LANYTIGNYVEEKKKERANQGLGHQAKQSWSKEVGRAEGRHRKRRMDAEMGRKGEGGIEERETPKGEGMVTEG